MNVFFFVVNYRADVELVSLIGSIVESRRHSPSTKIDVHVLDNSLKNEAQKRELDDVLSRSDVPVRIEHAEENLGYFGGLASAQAAVPPDADCVIYANPDILVEENFFLCLERADRSAALLAPRIMPVHGGGDLNPMYTRRLSRGKLQRLKWIFSNPLTFGAFTALAAWMERSPTRKADAGPPSQRIYAPHGSILVFADVNFFLSLPPYPCFLFGEELFIAEEARAAGLEIRYEPTLTVADLRHKSISLLSSKRRRVSQYESVSHILARYYAKALGHPGAGTG